MKTVHQSPDVHCKGHRGQKWIAGSQETCVSTLDLNPVARNNFSRISSTALHNCEALYLMFLSYDILDCGMFYFLLLHVFDNCILYIFYIIYIYL